MESGNWIALVSALFACGAAFYVRKAATEARRQNEIAIHREKLKIFKGFEYFRIRLKGFGADVSDDDYLKLHDLVELSRLYYPKAAYDAMNTFRAQIEQMRDLGQVIELNGGNDRVNQVKQRTDKFYECRSLADKLTEVMKEDLSRIRTQDAPPYRGRFSTMTWGKFSGWLRLGVVLSACFTAAILGYVSYEGLTSTPCIIEHQGQWDIFDQVACEQGYHFVTFVPKRVDPARLKAAGFTDAEVNTYKPVRSLRVFQVKKILVTIATSLGVIWVLVVIIPVLMSAVGWVGKGFK
jgi:hypothetical protein